MTRTMQPHQPTAIDPYVHAFAKVAPQRSEITEVTEASMAKNCTSSVSLAIMGTEIAGIAAGG